MRTPGQFLRLRRTVKRQRTILGIVLRRSPAQTDSRQQRLRHGHRPSAHMLERAERIRTQQTHDKNKLYALHAPEVGASCKGKARKRYEFGVKASIVVTHKSGTVVGAAASPAILTTGILAAQLEQTNPAGRHGQITQTGFVDLGYRGVGSRPSGR